MYYLQKRAKIIRWSVVGAFLILLILAIQGCSLPDSGVTTPVASAGAEGPSAPTEASMPGEGQPTEAAATEGDEAPAPEGTQTSAEASPGEGQIFLPHISVSGGAEPEPGIQPAEPLGDGPHLAFLKEGDLWVVAVPSGTPRQMTQTGDLLSFVWSGDGKRLATFNGQELCFVESDGSVRTACLDLGLDERQSLIMRLPVWSPDQRYIVLWNPVNPWDEGAIGWLIVALDGTGTTFRIEDPVDWGLAMAPENEAGGITGQPLFLADGTLIGTLTHRWMCGSGGCHYQLYQFDMEARSFTPYANKPEEGWSEGQSLAISGDFNKLANFGTFYNGCEAYTSFVDAYDLSSQDRQTFNIDQEALSFLTLSPTGSQAVVARSAGCSSENETTWAAVCGLSQGFDVYNMNLWGFADDARVELPPGLFPTWSPDGGWVAFRSCLVQGESGGWESSAMTSPSIYFMAPNGKELSLAGEGSSPAWRP